MTRNVWLLCILLLLTSCRIQYRKDVEPRGAAAKWSYGYQKSLRYDGYDNVAGDLEVGVFLYQKKNAPNIVLFATLPVGEAEFYKNLSQNLKRCDLVFLQGPFYQPQLQAIRDKVLYRSLASLFGLVAQGEVLQREKNWILLEPTAWILPMPDTPKRLLTEIELPRYIQLVKREISPLIPPRQLEDTLKHYSALELVKSPEGLEERVWKGVEQMSQILSVAAKAMPDVPLLKELSQRLETFLRQTSQAYRLRQHFSAQHRLTLYQRKLKQYLKPSQQQAGIVCTVGQRALLHKALQNLGYKLYKTHWQKIWKLNSQKSNLFQLPPQLPHPEEKADPTARPRPKSTIRKIIPLPPKAMALWQKYQKGSWQERTKLDKKIRSIGDGFSLFLLSRLRSKDPKERMLALQVLAKLKRLPKLVVPALIQVLEKDSQPTVRFMAAQALQQYPLGQPKHIQAIQRHYSREKNTAVLHSLAIVMARNPKAFAPFVISQLKQGSPLHRRYATLAISQTQRADQFYTPVLPLLMQNLQASDRSLKLYSLMALYFFGPKAKKAVPLLLQQFPKEPSHIQRAIIRAFGHIGPDAEAAVPLLVKQYSVGKKGPLNVNILRALGAIRKRPDLAIPLLQKAMKKPSSRWELLEALRAVASFGEQAAPLTEQLLEILNDPKHRQVWPYAIRALGAIGPKAKKAVPTLKKLAKQKSWLSWEAKRALQKIEGKK